MAIIDKQEVKYLRDRYSVLTGATILEATVITQHSVYGKELWPAMKLKLRDGQVMWVHVDRDPEGNGPGHLSGWELA